MDKKKKIIELLLEYPNGLKAREIAKKLLDMDKKEVNQILYGNPSDFVSADYVWKAKKTKANSLDVEKYKKREIDNLNVNSCANSTEVNLLLKDEYTIKSNRSVEEVRQGLELKREESKRKQDLENDEVLKLSIKHDVSDESCEERIIKDAEKDFNRHRLFLYTEYNKAYRTIRWEIRTKYFAQRNKEEEEYKKSDKYKRLKKKQYWSKPKEQRDLEDLNDVLSKLDLYVPSKAPGNEHITYVQKAMRDVSNSYEDALGFVPTMTIEEFFMSEAIKLKKETNHPLILYIIDSLYKFSDNLKNSSKFDDILFSQYKENTLCVVDYMKDLQDFLIKLGYKSEKTSDVSLEIHYKFCRKRIDVVVDMCKLIVTDITNDKDFEINVNLLKNSEQIELVGRKNGEMFFLNNKHYKIKEIYG